MALTDRNETGLGDEVAALKGFVFLLGWATLPLDFEQPAEDELRNVATCAEVLVDLLDRKVKAVERLNLEQAKKAG